MESDAQLCLPLVMRRKAVCRRTGMTLTMLRRAMEKDAFPRPIKLSARAEGWLVDAVEAWLEKNRHR